MKTSTIRNSVITLLSITVLIIFWWILSYFIKSEVILPSPYTTFLSLIEIVKSQGFFLTIGLSILRGVTAFLIACLAGIVVGLLVGVSKTADSLTKPLLILIMSTPVVSFILLALIWFKTDIVPIFVAFLIIFPIIVSNVSRGIKDIDSKVIQMAKVYRVKNTRIIKEIYLPSVKSYLFAGIITSVGIGWKVIITAEVLSQPDYAIGTSLQTFRIYLETSYVFAWTFIALFISFLFERVVRIFEKRIIRW